MPEQLLRRDVKQFQGGLVFKAHRLVYQTTPGWRVIKETKNLSTLGACHLFGNVGCVVAAGEAQGRRALRPTHLVQKFGV